MNNFIKPIRFDGADTEGGHPVWIFPAHIRFVGWNTMRDQSYVYIGAAHGEAIALNMSPDDFMKRLEFGE